MKIPYTPIDLSDQKPTDIRECFLLLGENNLRFVLDFYAEEPINLDDKELGWHIEYNYFDITVMKYDIGGVEMSWLDKSKLYGIYVVMASFSKDIKMFFKKRSAAQEMKEIINKWLTE